MRLAAVGIVRWIREGPWVGRVVDLDRGLDGQLS